MRPARPTCAVTAPWATACPDRASGRPLLVNIRPDRFDQDPRHGPHRRRPSPRRRQLGLAHRVDRRLQLACLRLLAAPCSPVRDTAPRTRGCQASNGRWDGPHARQIWPRTFSTAPEKRIKAASIPIPWRKAASHPSGSIQGYITIPGAPNRTRAPADGLAATGAPGVGSPSPSWSGRGDAHGEREGPSCGNAASLRAAKCARNATASDILFSPFDMRF